MKQDDKKVTGINRKILDCFNFDVESNNSNEY